jgi:hypothetical protein
MAETTQAHGDQHALEDKALAAQGRVVPDSDLAFVVASLIDMYAP